ncbi:MAG TPA: hypothetical protein EYH12_05780 [Psychromonas hadalis]|nr:hypothetical protein [Gammaproteobacteria bacterium]HIP76619.1 hypothetical protein [Psychromonas hadalis]
MLYSQRNVISLFLVLIAQFLIESIGYMDFSIGNLLYLPLGATLYCYILFGPRAIPGVVVANTLIGYFLWDNWFGNGMSGFSGHVVVGSLAPMLAIITVKYFQLNSFSGSNKINYGPCMFLIILTALINTIAKFFTFMDILIEEIEPIIFLGSFFVGDVLGCVVFFLVASKFLTPLLARYRLI